MPRGDTRGQRLHSLTSLRAVAAALVFAHHSFPFMGSLGHLWGRLGQQGNTGVTFFFILSGFVLTWSTHDRDTPRAFYRRRFARIAPSYWLVGLIAIPVVVYLTGSSGVWRSFVPLTFLQSWFPAANIHFAGNSVGWSLSDEAFFYALFPFIVAPISAQTAGAKVRIAAASAALLLVLVIVLQPNGNTTSDWLVYVAPFIRVAEFIIGICLCSLLRDGRQAPVALPLAAVIAAAAYVVMGWLPTYFDAGGLMVIPFALLIWAAASSDLQPGRHPLHARWLINLGQWSFAFYLVHDLIIQVIAKAAGSSLTLLPVALIVSLAAAYALFTLVEHPLEKSLRDGRSAMPDDEAR